MSTSNAPPDDVTQPGPVRAPELTGARGWLNVPGPLSLRALRGKVVLLDFWTYGCVNCMHVLPDLKKLEEKYARELVVIGIHSGKFATEKDLEQLRRIVLRYEIEHPVANDADMAIWRAYAVRAWPTRVIVDPLGYVVGTASGEGNHAGFDQAIAGVIRVFDVPPPPGSPATLAGLTSGIDRTPLPLTLERAATADMPLAFPGKIAADAASGRLFVADSGHHRVVVTDLGGDVVEVIGSGLPGVTDGPIQQARFRRPQGILVEGHTLYVADTGNHLVRQVDLEAQMVTTIAGTGQPAAPGGEAPHAIHHVARGPRAGGDAHDTALSSPWDLALRPGILIVAMAGTHQLWVIDLINQQAYPYAGSGAEGRHDGTVGDAAFAQPSGLAMAPDGTTLYVADAESSAVRAVALPPGNAVRTLAGGDLFEFGHRDARGDQARFQHPLAVAVHDGLVYVADTYNHRIRGVDPRSGQVTTIAGTGEPGLVDGPAAVARFDEPGGLAAANGVLYVADTNNHAVRRVDLATGVVSTLPLHGLAPPRAWSYLGAPPEPVGLARETHRFGLVRVGAGDEGAIEVDVALPPGIVPNPHVQHRYAVFLNEEPVGEAALGDDGPPALPLVIPFAMAAPGRVALALELDLFLCDARGAGACTLRPLRWEGVVEIAGDAAERVVALRA